MIDASIARQDAATRVAGRRARPVDRSSRRASLRRGLSVLALSMSVLAVGSVDAGNAVPADAATLLDRIQQAAQKQNYVGTFVHQQGNQVQSSRVTHVTDRSGEHEKLEMMDGQAREFIRHNDEVRCYVPDRKLVLVEKRARYDSFPALLTSAPVDLDKYYDLAIEGGDRIAGHRAQLVVLTAKDRLRYGYRLWFDRDSFLLLKAQTVGEKGDTIEQVAFTDLVIGGSIDATRVKPTATDTKGWRIETSQMLPVDLARAGWTVGQPVAGFRKVMEVRRAFGGREDVGQMVYSDGLAAISIFIESTPPRDVTEGVANRGPVNIRTEHHGDYWLTVVGDAPANSISDMAKQIAFKNPK